LERQNSEAVFDARVDVAEIATLNRYVFKNYGFPLLEEFTHLIQDKTVIGELVGLGLRILKLGRLYCHAGWQTQRVYTDVWTFPILKCSLCTVPVQET
jgi:hypothetical protein